MAIFPRWKAQPATEPQAAAPARQKASELASRVLIRPHVTEKSTASGSRSEYVFIAHPHATKPEVRRAVEEHYGVNVVAVRVLNMPGKVRSRGRTLGWRPGFRKAIVTLRAGQSIDLAAAK